MRLFFSFLLIVWCAGFLFPVITPAFAGKYLISYFVAHFYSPVCHQSESARIIIGESHLLICARCTGIYLGALGSLVILTLSSMHYKLSLKPFLLFSLPLVTDAIAVRIGLYPYSKIIAFFTGLSFGSIVIIYILETIEKSFVLQKNNYDS